MFVMKDGEKLYLRNWEYNACRILSELAVIVENNGGKVMPGKKPLIINRTLSSAIRECKEKIEAVEKRENIAEEKRAAYIKNQREQLEEMEAINNDPIMVSHTNWIYFTYENDLYYYSVDDNPFFPFHYRKTPIVNGKYSQDAACEEDEKNWLFDCFFSFRASGEDVREAANLIFNMLTNAKHSVIIRDGRRQRVPNTYNSGYHYETIYRPERWEKLGDWAK